MTAVQVTVLCVLASWVIFSCHPRVSLLRWWERKKAERRDFENYMQREATLAALGRVTAPRCVPDPPRALASAKRGAAARREVIPPPASRRAANL